MFSYSETLVLCRFPSCPFAVDFSFPPLPPSLPSLSTLVLLVPPSGYIRRSALFFSCRTQQSMTNIYNRPPFRTIHENPRCRINESQPPLSLFYTPRTRSFPRAHSASPTQASKTCQIKQANENQLHSQKARRLPAMVSVCFSLSLLPLPPPPPPPPPPSPSLVLCTYIFQSHTLHTYTLKLAGVRVVQDAQSSL